MSFGLGVIGQIALTVTNVDDADQRITDVVRRASGHRLIHVATHDTRLCCCKMPALMNSGASFLSRLPLFADVSPELMQGVDTYKNQTAEMIEGENTTLLRFRRGDRPDGPAGRETRRRREAD